MSYQIPSKSKAKFLLGETSVDLYKLTPMQTGSHVTDVIFKYAVVTMFIKGHVGADFKMRLNVYDPSGTHLLFSSLPVNNLDLNRSDDMYTDLRFEFPRLGNLMSLGKQHMVKFEIYDGYTYDTGNYVALMMSPLGAQSFLGSDFYDLADAPDLGVICSFFFDTPNPSTEDFFMCRIQGAKLLNGIVSETAYDTASKWYYTTKIQPGLVFDSFKIKNGTTGVITTLVNAGLAFIPNPLNYSTHINEYYYNKKTGDLYFYTNKQLGSDQYGMIEYFLFVTDTRGKYAPSDMASFGAGQIVYWEPRLTSDLAFNFSQQNNLQGLLSISSSPVILKNQDGYLNGFFSVNDCFNNREVKVWRCKGDASINTFEFIGVIKSASFNDEQCVFEIADPLSKLNNTFNDGRPKRYGNTTYALRDIDRLSFIPRVYGKISKFAQGWYNTGTTLPVVKINEQNSIQATCVSYNPITKTTATNRTWSCGFGPASAAVMSRDVTAVNTFTAGTFNSTKFTINNSLGPVNEWLPVGTTIMNNGKYGVVYDSNATEAYVWPQSASFSAAFDIFRQKVISVILMREGAPFHLNGGESYTCQIGVHGDLQIVFVNGFESIVPGLGGVPVDPDADEVFIVMMNDEADAKASSIVKDLLQKSGLAVSPSFIPDQTPAWTDIELAFTLDGDLPKYRDLVEMCLKSAMSFIYFDSNGWLRYKAFMQTIQSPTNIALTDNQSGLDASDAITQGNSKEFSVSFDLWDLYCGVRFNFSHCIVVSMIEYSTNMAMDFYKTENLFDLDTVVDPTRVGASAFYVDYGKVVMGRSAVFSITALAEHMNLYIGDDVIVRRKNLIDGQAEITLRVVSKNKKQSGAALDLMDLKRFPST